MWRIMPVLVCIIYAAIGALFFAVPLGMYSPDAGWWLITHAFWAIVTCLAAVGVGTIPLIFGR